MKFTILVAVLSMMAVTGHAEGVDDYGAMVQQQGPVCGMGGVTVHRTSFLAGAATPCCDGRVQCNQLLATTKIARPRINSHT